MTERDRYRDRNQQPQRRSALGKGITSLLGGMDYEPANTPEQVSPQIGTPSTIEIDEKAPGISAGQVWRIKVSSIEPNPQQPRKLFDDKALHELAASLKTDGVLQPVVVSRSEDDPDKFVLIAGERRWRASRLNGFDTIPAIIKEGASQDLLRLALIENIQRADLNVIEEAEAYDSLIKDYGLTQEQCADRVGKERSTVTNALRLLNLPREVQDDLLEGRVTMGHGRALLSLDDKKLVLRARDIVIKKQLSVRQTEQLCRTIKSGKIPKEGGAVGKNTADLEYMADSLRGHLKTKVKIAGSTDRGRIEISFFSAAELERILSIVGPRMS